MQKKNLKQLIVAGSISLLAATISILSFVNFANNKGSSLTSKEWMKGVADTKLISQISIPGTHDSGALYSIADLAGKCQDVSISKQLNFGARFLDIRLENNNGTLKVVHGIVDERETFDGVINACQNFLKKHPSETIIMSIKEENIDKKGEFKNKLEGVFEKNPSLWYLNEDIPSLAEVRGKIVLFSRYQGNKYGVSLNDQWQDNKTFDIVNGGYIYHIQDHYKLDNNEDKWKEVDDCFNFSNSNLLANVYTINFLSGYLTYGFPPSYAVPVAKYINQKVQDNLLNYQNTGTVLFDFINEGLAKLIYERNF